MRLEDPQIEPQDKAKNYEFQEGYKAVKLGLLEAVVLAENIITDTRSEIGKGSRFRIPMHKITPNIAVPVVHLETTSKQRIFFSRNNITSSISLEYDKDGVNTTPIIIHELIFNEPDLIGAGMDVTGSNISTNYRPGMFYPGEKLRDHDSSYISYEVVKHGKGLAEYTGGRATCYQKYAEIPPGDLNLTVANRNMSLSDYMKRVLVEVHSGFILAEDFSENLENLVLDKLGIDVRKRKLKARANIWRNKFSRFFGKPPEEF